jgi:hypothetical protein
MKQYTLSEKELSELLERQRLNCGDAYNNIPLGEMDVRPILNAPAPAIDEGMIVGEVNTRLNAQYLLAHGYKFVDMMFSNDPVRYWRKDKLIVRKTETGFAIDLFNDKEQHFEIEVNTTQKLHQIEELLTKTPLLEDLREPISMGYLRDLIRLYDLEKISLSKFLEMLNNPVKTNDSIIALFNAIQNKKA